MYEGEGLTSVGAGRYELIQTVGRGGMATVHEAVDSALGRKVAVKVMHRAAASEEFRARFQQEARAVGGLNTPTVVAVHDIGEEPVPDGDSVPYMVMEFVEGRPLSQFVSAGPMPVDEALRITADVLDGLAASHKAGLIHRDIKPANVMMTMDGDVKVLDFGIARAIAADASPITRTGTVVGTAHYMSPEQAQGKELDHRSDLYPTGVLLFELLSGRRPFHAESEAALLYHHVHSAPPLLSSLGVTVPEAVQRLISRSLDKEPDKRPSSAGQMRSMILAAMQMPVSRRTSVAQPTPIPERPAYDPIQPPPVPPENHAPRSAGSWWGNPWVGITVAAFGYIAGLISFRFVVSLSIDARAIGILLFYGLMYMSVLYGLFVGIRNTRAAAPQTSRRSLGVLCILSIFFGVSITSGLGYWDSGFCISDRAPDRW
ncbi:protein kinase domain-containing protein [Streptomyces cacaoi]|uniref:non-specific serine/threonine protein kinase n=1 Tax=Streptomyces cacaoi TaxID=1898 RepID=A0A4Y3R1J1_STRCI|nr:protein kinase [Streptomyces cacaoi]NNG89345.1 serine/threonine protein kinase [Streptomyces cacaoi]GEB50633.1 hypothetical protein SCA03_31840 [Streptomyces cacaoi]